MQSFEYANPSSLKEALSLLGSNWDDAHVLAGGTDQISLMKDYVHTPKRVVNIKNIKELHGINIEVSQKKLEEANVNLDTPITKVLKGVTLKSALTCARPFRAFPPIFWKLPPTYHPPDPSEANAETTPSPIPGKPGVGAPVERSSSAAEPVRGPM